MGLVRNCRMLARGDDWVKLLVDVAYGGRIPDFDAFKAEHDLLWHRLKVSHPAMGDGPGGYGRPEVAESGFWDDDRVVFKFRVEPYSEEINDLFQYVYDLGELADKRTERKAEVAGFAESLRGIGESIRKFAESRQEPAIDVQCEDVTEPGIGFCDSGVRPLSSRFAKYGII